MRQNLKSDQNQMIDEDAKEKLKEIRSDLASDFERLGQVTKNVAVDSLDTVKGELEHLYQKAQQKFSEVSGSVGEGIRSRPMPSLLIAAGVGFLLGLLKRK